MIRRQLVGYAVAGVVQILVDWGIFVGLTALGSPVPVSNVASRLLAALLGFWLNGRFTFSGQVSGLGSGHAARYAASWAVMTALSTLAVRAADGLAGLHAAWLFKPAIDVVLAGLGFLVSKYWIYRRD